MIYDLQIACLILGIIVLSLSLIFGLLFGVFKLCSYYLSLREFNINKVVSKSIKKEMDNYIDDITYQIIKLNRKFNRGESNSKD